MANFLEQAQTAAQQGNWTQLSQSLQQWLLDAIAPASQGDFEQGLRLALTVLEAGDFQSRWEIAKVLPAFGQAAIAPLIDLLQDEEADLESRWFAARILGQFDHPDVIETLIGILQTAADEELTMMAAEALANLGSAAIAPLTTLLQDPTTRLFAVQSMAKIRHPETIPPLLTVVNDPQPAIRAMAIEALGSFHDPQILPVLIQALTDPAAVVRRTAVATLGVQSNQMMDTDRVSYLADRLWDLNLDVCQQAAIALGRLGTDRAVEALFRVLKSPHTPAPLQLETIRALGWAETALALECLEQSLTLLGEADTPPFIYQEIVTTLGHWAAPSLQPRASQILIDLLHSTHPAIADARIRQAIALGLGHLGQIQALEPLTQLLADPEIGVQLHAIAALKTLDLQASLRHLETLSQQDDLSEAMKRGVAIALEECRKGSRDRG
jgi:HEAT repeat protein